ncbi:uncharacterized protein cubi_03378 [Cryptosporidium ubiquitum]|uniref:Uncharacterized protein n=1 Tax=Cryptosporidium ubiquitum TaxID=857276 RepID=A0A1J4MKM7_9CRYT|nr:uncharacterized protein cubi_03378 [Cryptosporidium ubiquitum]OII73580.1 hypothetical protein cubi_03378 [Cryptosporidium ubiquitum]
MTYDEHLELRNDLYQTSLKLFHSDIKWFSEYIPSVSKWRVKVMLREELKNFTNENDQNYVNKSTTNGRNSPQNNMTNSFQIEENSININNSEDSPRNTNLKQNVFGINDAVIGGEEISIKLLPTPNHSEAFNLHYSNELCGMHEKPDSSINNLNNACKINVENNKELPVYNNLHVDNSKNELSEPPCTKDEEKKNEIKFNINFENDEKRDSEDFNENKDSDKMKNDFSIYNILTGEDGKYFREKCGNISSFGLTLWEYLPLVAILSGCTGIFIILRLSSAMYRYSILSCTISHLVTFMLIGIPLSQLEFSMRKRGQRYGFLEAMQYFNPKYVGITILSLVTVVVIFLYSVQIISTISVILYNIPKKLWRVTLEDELICSRINNSIYAQEGNFIDQIKSGNLTAQKINYGYSLCSFSSICNVVAPFFQDSNEVMDAVNSYTNIGSFNSGNTVNSSRLLGEVGLQLFMKAVQSDNSTNDSSTPINYPTWCIPSPLKKLRNLFVMQQSGYQEAIYFSLNNAIINTENIIKTRVFPIKKPLRWLNSNLYARICGLSISLIFIIFSINGGGKLYRMVSFLSFLSLITLFLTASIQIVANDIQLSIFISILVTQEGIENLFSPAIWYCSINNTLLFFGISFLITMFPLKEIIKEDYNSSTSNPLSYKNDGFYDGIIGNNLNSSSKAKNCPILNMFDNEKEQTEKVPMSFKEPRIGEITLRKHVSRMYKSVYNQEMEKNESKYRNDEVSKNNTIPSISIDSHTQSIETQNNHTEQNMALKLHQINQEHTNFPSLMSAANSAVFFLACVIISSMVVLISNAAFISLTESPNTTLLLPFNRHFGKTSITAIIKDNINQNKVNESSNEKSLKIDQDSYNIEDIKSKQYNYFTIPKYFHGNNWLMHDMFEPDSGHFQEIFQFFNGESASTEEINFLKNHMTSWFKWNFIQIKFQSLILGEYMVIYLIMIGIEVSKRIPSGVIIFFILVVFSFAISSACICTSIISKHIFVIFNYWILPIIGPKFGILNQDSNLNNSNKKNIKNIRRLKSCSHSKHTIDNLNYCVNSSNFEIEENKESKKKKGEKSAGLKKLSVIYKIKCFLKLIFCILSSFCLLIKKEILKFFGISYRNKKNRNAEKMTFFIQFAFITLLMVTVLLTNIVTAFIPRFPLDNQNVNDKVLKEQLELNKMAFLNFSDKNELSKYYKNELYISKTFNIIFGSLFDIQIISNAANFMLALTAGLETIILTWYMYRDIQEEIVGKNALKCQAIGYIISTILLSIGFLFGTKYIFVLFILLSSINYLITFIIARYFAKKNFKSNHEQVIKRQKYSPTWWLYISNIDFLRRKLNSKELEDAGSLNYYSEKSTIQVSNLNSNHNHNHNNSNYNHNNNSNNNNNDNNNNNNNNSNNNNNNNSFYGLNKMKISQNKYFAKNEELIQSISNFNLYCNVRSRQPLFISFWFIMAKYFSSILIFSTIPLNIANTISMLFLRLECLEGIIPEIFLMNYISNMKTNTINIFNRVSIFQPIQVLVITLLMIFGISTALIITIYIKLKGDKLKKLSNSHTKNSSFAYIQGNPEENQEINLNNILDDVYESLKVPKCAELYLNNKIENLGKMPQKLIISLAMHENYKLLNRQY